VSYTLVLLVFPFLNQNLCISSSVRTVIINPTTSPQENPAEFADEEAQVVVPDLLFLSNTLLP
jgi:hypothetical protein